MRNLILNQLTVNKILATLISILLEPISYLIITIALAFYLKLDNSGKIWVLFMFNFHATLLMSLASKSVFTQESNIDKYNLLFTETTCSLGIYFYLTLFSRYKKILILILVALSLLYFAFSNLTLNKAAIFDSAGYSILSLSVVMMVFMYFNQILRNVSVVSMTINVDFWLNTAFLIYYLGSFIIFLTFYYLTKKVMVMNVFKDRLLLTYLWGGHNILLFISAVSIAGGVIWIVYQRK